MDNEKMLVEISRFIEKITYYKGDVELGDDCITYSDRIAPGIESGKDYNFLVKKVKSIMKDVQTMKYGKFITTEYEYTDEWVGFRVKLKK